MAVSLSPLAGAGWQFFDNNGLPLAGGLLYTYTAGTSTPQATYTTSAGSVANANPIVLDSSGRTTTETWLTQGIAYKFILQTSAGVQIWSNDNVSGINDFTAIYSALSASTGSSLIGYNQGLTGAVTETLQAKLKQTVSVKDFGAVGDGVTDDTTAIQNALNAATGNNLVFPAATSYKVSSTLTIPTGTSVNFQGQKSIIKFTGTSDCLSIANSKNVFLTNPVIDLTNAGANAVALHIKGLWLGGIYNPSITLNNANQGGIYIETSSTGGNNFGSYCIDIINPQIFGTVTSLYGIQTQQTSGDSVGNTHIRIENGWVNKTTSGISLNYTNSSRLCGTTFEAITGDGVYLANCQDVFLSLGEIDSGNYNINFGSGNGRIYDIGSSQSGSWGAGGRVNWGVYVPTTIAYNANPAFSAYLSSNQTITASSWTKVQINTKEFDTNTNFNTSTYRFTPNIPGYYQINCKCDFENSTSPSRTMVSIYKNGVETKRVFDLNISTGVNYSAIGGSGLVYLNGSTDYIEMYCYVSATTAIISSGSNNTYFQASLIRGGQ
jgi:hypothetical protein